MDQENKTNVCVDCGHGADNHGAPDGCEHCECAAPMASGESGDSNEGKTENE